ncbi:MAG: S24 family peptidase [Devosia marina]|uniref:S24 family peptidase n=1 Tax=Devosia marina TaxID=2683198 RepID=UPI0032EC3422
MPHMTTGYERIRARIDELHPGTSDRAASLAATGGKNPDLLRTMKQGRSAFPRGANLQGLADYLQKPVEWLTGEGEEAAGAEIRPSRPAQLQPVKVNGKLAAGVFREVDDFDQSEPERIWETPDEKFPNARRMAFDVEGDSMNALEPRPIMPGDRLICVAFEDVANQVRVRDGLVVVVERTRDGGHTREWSVKQVELYEDRTEFCPRSTNKAHKPIVVKRDAQADEGVQVEIIALVRSVRNDLPL